MIVPKVTSKAAGRRCGSVAKGHHQGPNGGLSKQAWAASKLRAKEQSGLDSPTPVLSWAQKAWMVSSITLGIAQWAASVLHGFPTRRNQVAAPSEPSALTM